MAGKVKVVVGRRRVEQPPKKNKGVVHRNTQQG